MHTLADVAAVLADRSRAAMCLALLDGRAWTVGELAGAAGVAASTASEHVGVLTDAGFVDTLRQGRHRYVRLAGADVAELIERLTQHARPLPPVGLRAALRENRLAAARTCYNHLAGRLGVALRDGMLAAGLIDDSGGLSVTPAGWAVLAELQVDVPARHPLLKDCLDWTERREHLSGAVPVAILTRALAAGWLVRIGHRAIRVAPGGQAVLARLGVPDLGAGSGTAATG
jgi:DNA-binding transcriptional ArsR family regulator